MQIPSEADPDIATVEAARRGDRYALDDLTAAYLPLVYNIVGRAMNGHPDVDDVVQETMLRAVRSIGELREPTAFRSWLVAIAMTQVRGSYRDRLARPPAVDLPVLELNVHSPDFTDQTIERLGLTGQRRETAEATRWLDDDDRPVLALWWQEAAGELSRNDLAAGLGLSTAHAAVRVQRMKERLGTSRTVVRALHQVPQCTSLEALAARWDGEPSPLWRKRLARHVRECAWCLADAELIPAERLLGALPLLAVPAGIAGRALSRAAAAAQPGFAQPGPGQPLSGHAARGHSGAGHGRALSSARHARHARVLGKASLALQPKLIAASVAVVTCVAGGTVAAVHAHGRATPPPSSASAAPSLTTTHAVAGPPPPTHATPAKHPTPPATHPATQPATKPATKPAAVPPPVTVTSARKGVSTWNFTGVSKALALSGASWYYNWGSAPNGITAPASAAYVPMIWGAGSVTASTLAQVEQEGHVLLSFNEPDMSGQANMTVSQALALWPKLEATGMTLGSPAVAYDAATPGGWLDQFMAGAQARGYRVNFITVHWYGGDFQTADAVQELQTYLQAVYARYHLPIWLTEFALTGYSGGQATFPTESQQAAFVTASGKMLDSLPYLERYAWFALPTSPGSGTTGLFNPGPTPTAPGRAFESAR